MGDEEVEYKAEYLDTAEDAEPEVSAHFAMYPVYTRRNSPRLSVRCLLSM